jgi:hypothetical protein
MLARLAWAGALSVQGWSLGCLSSWIGLPHEALMWAGCAAGLQELVLSNSRFTHLPPELGCHLGFGGMPSLTSLDLSGCERMQLTALDMHGLPTTLRRLSLGHCNLAGLPGGDYLSGTRSRLSFDCPLFVPRLPVHQYAPLQAGRTHCAWATGLLGPTAHYSCLGCSVSCLAGHVSCSLEERWSLRSQTKAHTRYLLQTLRSSASTATSAWPACPQAWRLPPP